MVDKRRREFITLLGMAALAARAQQPAMPMIGYLSARSREDTPHLIAAFQRGLAESDYVDGRNVTIEYRFALGQYDKLPAMANELVRPPVTVIATTGGEPAALAAKAATSTTPIVFAIGSDPVKHGRTASINRPGGNATGITSLTNENGTKTARVVARTRAAGAHDRIFVESELHPGRESARGHAAGGARDESGDYCFSRQYGSRDRRGIRSYRPTARSCPRCGSQAVF